MADNLAAMKGENFTPLTQLVKQYKVYWLNTGSSKIAKFSFNFVGFLYSSVILGITTKYHLQQLKHMLKKSTQKLHWTLSRRCKVQDMKRTLADKNNFTVSEYQSILHTKKPKLSTQKHAIRTNKLRLGQTSITQPRGKQPVVQVRLA